MSQEVQNYEKQGKLSVNSTAEYLEWRETLDREQQERACEYETYLQEQEERMEELKEKIDSIYDQWRENVTAGS